MPGTRPGHDGTDAQLPKTTTFRVIEEMDEIETKFL
jgi:hypothetical protein